jgi:hypothetical protein
MISFETISWTHGWMVCACLAVKIYFLPGSFDFSAAAYNAIFVLFLLEVVDEAGNFVWLFLGNFV